MSKWMGIAACALAATLSGCAEDITPGDYVVLHIASAEQELSSGCYYPDGGAGPNEREDSSSLMASGTIVLYAGPEQIYYLDTGSMTLDGEKAEEAAEEGDIYEFAGKAVDVEWTNANGTGDKWVTTEKATVDLMIDGSLVTGKSVIKKTWQCTGNGCANIPPQCKTTTEFVGMLVEDVELDHTVN